MRGNHFGKLFSFMSFGESHGEAIGVVIDGMPSNIDFNLADLQAKLDRRAPGVIQGTTTRKEADLALVLSGIYQNKTLGSPIAIITKNTNQKSEDYEKIKNDPRPGHADQTTLDKFGIRDHRGGGRSSGRETWARVVAGYFAELMIPKVRVRAFISELGPFVHDEIPRDLDADWGPYSFPEKTKTKEIEAYLLDLKARGDSRGGVVTICVDNCPKGLGEPAFDKLKADLAKGLMSIGAVVSFSFGLGEKMAKLNGQEMLKEPQAFSGIEGGISNGEQIILRITMKPTSTVGQKAQDGRHDPCILPRAIPVVEAMVYCVLADHYLRQQAYRV